MSRLRALVPITLLVAACRTPQSEARGVPAPPPGEVWIDPRSPKLASLTVDTVRTRSERVVATLPAQVIPDENHTVRVLSPVTGRVRELLAEPGDHVSAGQPLARIVSGDFAQAASDLAKARAALSVASAALTRATDLYEHHVAALKELEQARSDEAQARAELARARARAEQLGARDDGVNADYVLRAPIAGVVLDRSANAGAEVRPDLPAPLFTISSLGDVWLAVSVYQRDLPHVRRGARLIFVTDASPGRQFQGHVSFVSAALDPQTRTATVRATLDNSDAALRPQTVGEARLLAPEAATTLVVATKALVTHGSETVVYVERARGKFVRRTVTIGDDDGTWASITSGLSPGDRVVTDGSILLDAEANRVH